MRVSTVLALMLLGGCFKVTHLDGCEEVSRTELTIDEATPIGTAAELLALVAVDGTFPGTYGLDGSPVDVELWLDQDAPASWVEVQPTQEVRRSFGVGEEGLTWKPTCRSRLELPVVAEGRTADGAVEVFVEGVATLEHGSEAPDTPAVSLLGAYDDATFPGTEHDPDAWDARYSFVDLELRREGLEGGSLGWGGEQESGNERSTATDHTVRFGLQVPATSTAEP